MQALSTAATAAIIAGTVAMTARVDLYRGDRLVRADVALQSASPGTVTVDETATVLRTCTLNFEPDAIDEPLPLVPLLGGPVEPSGNEAHVYIDLYLPDGTTETVPQGVFGIRRPTATDDGGAVVTVTGRDRSQRVIDATLTAPVDIGHGTNYATAIHDLIDAGVPGLTYLGFSEDSNPFSATADLHFPDGDNRWTRATDMAASMGRELRFDTAGRLVLRRVVDLSTAPVAWFYEDGASNLAGTITQSLDADQTFSHAAVLSQPLDGSPPLRADAFDDDPTSPTFFQGIFGDRVIRMVSSYITNQAQADTAAAALLLRHQGLIEDVTITAVPVVAHEDGDVIYVERPSLGVASHYVLSKFAIPLGPAGMDLTVRSRRVSS